ncbi:MAG TPA: hypothetical protein VNW53_07105 [Phenylobacterium sp.]|jgi:hypothetical protein|uniref:hypothetical protein n=1 Tax=Phenylobacterium sp. TaxID=1871053 RepID=UPI002D1DA1BE|nr:hypothetical protein [Phenylobacterium sp.]HXA38748.1 hypothetical protein [Phenylobacterium sp.]
MLDRRTLQSWAFVAVAVGGAIPILFLPNLLASGPHAPGDAETVLSNTACTVLALAWACVFAVLGFRRADEFVQQRSKFAWYWGSLIGIVVAAPLFVFVGLGGLRLLDPAASVGRDLARAFMLGVTLPLAAQVLGFAGVTLWWKATKR